MWRRAGRTLQPSLKWCNSRSFTAPITHCVLEDEGDWSYAPEWWDLANSQGHIVHRVISRHGNGIISIAASPSSRPRREEWAETERWLASRQSGNERFRVLGYQWRVLRFNEETRQSTVKVMAASTESNPQSLYLMQCPNCLAVPYVRTMVAVGLTTIASLNRNLLINAANGARKLRILCIGHGGGSLPLFLASKIKGAIIDIVEIDPLVISSSVSFMGFPSYSLTPLEKRHVTKPDFINEVLWKGVHERLFLHKGDAEAFILSTKNEYDMVFVDAYDGDDIFPRKLWDPDSPFLEALKGRLHHGHGAVFVNLHSDDCGEYVKRVGRAYCDVIGGEKCGGFSVEAPWVCNTILAVLRGEIDYLLLRNLLLNEAFFVEEALTFPFNVMPYVARGLTPID